MSQEEQEVSELKKLLEKEAEEAERKAKLYRLLLDIIERCKPAYTGRTGEEEIEALEYTDLAGKHALTVQIGKHTVKLFFIKPVTSKNPYIKYLLHVLKQLSEEKKTIKYDIASENNQIKTIIATGLGKDDIEEIKTTIDYITKKLQLTQKQEEY